MPSVCLTTAWKWIGVVLTAIAHSQIAAFVLGFVTATFAEPVRQFLFRPHLRLEFASGDDFKTPTPADGPNGRSQQYVVRVRATNESRRLARSCRAYLTNIEKLGADGHFHRTLYSDSLQLHWSVRHPADWAAVDVAHEIDQYIDVLVTQQDVPLFNPCVQFQPLRYDELLRDTGTFRLTVRAVGDGTTSAVLKLRLEWNGKWDTFRVGKED